MEDYISKNPKSKSSESRRKTSTVIDISSLGLNSKEFTKTRRARKVRVISGVTFGENGDNFIRVNIG